MPDWHFLDLSSPYRSGLNLFRQALSFLKGEVFLATIELLVRPSLRSVPPALKSLRPSAVAWPRTVCRFVQRSFSFRSFWARPDLIARGIWLQPFSWHWPRARNSLASCFPTRGLCHPSWAYFCSHSPGCCFCGPITFTQHFQPEWWVSPCWKDCWAVFIITSYNYK